MTTSQTTNLHLTKAVKGTNEPFSIDAVNANLDTIDAVAGSIGLTVNEPSTLDDLPLNAFGTVNNIPVSLRPNSILDNCLYISIGSEDNRALIFIRYGSPEIYLNTRNIGGWKGWRSVNLTAVN